MYTKIEYVNTHRANEVNDTFEAMIYMQFEFNRTMIRNLKFSYNRNKIEFIVQ